MRPQTIALLIFLPAVLLNASAVNAQYGQVVACPDELKPGFDSITQQKSRERLSVLAGEQCAGRGTGQAGYTAAAQYVAKQLVEMGLGPVPQSNGNTAGGFESLLQYVPLRQRNAIVEHCDITATGKIKIPAAGNIGFDSYSENATIDGLLVFANCPQGRFRFPQNTDFRGRIVIFQADDSRAKYVKRKIEQYGPLAIFRVVDSVPRSVGQIINENSFREPIRGSIVRPAAKELMSRIGFAMPAPIAGRQNSAELTSTLTNVTIHNPTRLVEISVPNVAAWLPGSDPAVAHEFVVIGAHLDHLGVASATTFFGADDNGSGSTALLNIAQALTINPLKPKRSILLMWFASEEHGLLGSNFYCKHPLADPNNMTAMLNIDMVGRNESSAKETAEENEGSIHLVGSKKGGSELHDAIMVANQHIGFRFEYDEESVFTRSDQYNFFEQGVQVAFLFGGFHPDYHRGSDTIDKINFPKIVSASRLFYLTLYKVAQHGRYSANMALIENQ